MTGWSVSFTPILHRDDNSGQRMIQRAIVDALVEGEILLWHM